jgi:hypothetical protein
MAQDPVATTGPGKVPCEHLIREVVSRHYERGVIPLIEAYFRFGLGTGIIGRDDPAYQTLAVVANEVRGANDHLGRALRADSASECNSQIDMMGWHYNLARIDLLERLGREAAKTFQRVIEHTAATDRTALTRDAKTELDQLNLQRATILRDIEGLADELLTHLMFDDKTVVNAVNRPKPTPEQIRATEALTDRAHSNFDGYTTATNDFITRHDRSRYEDMWTVQNKPFVRRSLYTIGIALGTWFVTKLLDKALGGIIGRAASDALNWVLGHIG